MIGLPLGFTTPLILTALLALPLLWILLRVVPPRPREMMFPPTRLLLDIRPKEETAARTPWWLTMLRLILAGLVITVAAGPVWNPPAATPAATGPLLLVIDQGWPAAPTWEQRMAVASGLIDDAERQGRGIALVPTGEVPKDVTLLLPAQAREKLRALTPMPVLPDRAQAFALAARHVAAEPGASLVFISDGTRIAAHAPEDADLPSLPLSEPPLVIAGGLAAPLALAAPQNAAGALSVKVLRPVAGAPRAGKVEARDQKGLSLGLADFAFDAQALETEAQFDMPVEVRNDIARIEIVGEHSAGAVQLLDKRWRRRNVGVVSGASIDTGQPLLAPTYYLSRALGPFADVRVAESGAPAEAIKTFLDQRVSVLMLTDVGTIPASARARLVHFIEDGGVLVRFAGPHLANTQDDLLPVHLRRGGRVLGGSLSWETPQPLGGFSADGPFADLRLPDDVSVSQQVLAEPDGALGEHSWASLKDGTPLVTGARMGKGALVLFHVTADTSWSNLPLSGTFVEMLRRTVALADTAALVEPNATSAATGAPAAIPPNRMLDGFGRFHPPGPLARPLTAGFTGRASLEHPPGFYGPPDALVAVNALLPTDKLAPLDISPLKARTVPLRAKEALDLRGPLLVAVMILLLLDALAVLLLAGGLTRLSGRLTKPRGSASAAMLIGALVLGSLFGLPAPAHADDTFAIKATSQTHLAYVRTGDAEVDRISEAGLSGLSTFLGQRTSLQAGDPIGVDLAKDELSFFPLLYWPILPDRPVPSQAVLNRVDAFMKQGGTVIFDTRDALEAPADSTHLSPAGARLREILSGLDIPELEPVPRDHVLTKAFYLLKDFPGRFTGGATWVEALPRLREGEERPARAGDGVSPLIITGNDLAGAWAVGQDGDPLLPLTPGEPRQREFAFRTGVNIAMYVLTGNYKADQVHVPALLERLGQ